MLALQAGALFGLVYFTSIRLYNLMAVINRQGAGEKNSINDFLVALFAVLFFVSMNW